jgi:2-desacetyl-2-hydroxyethyl bacteriochlorophyllide A dehydrogenase
MKAVVLTAPRELALTDAKRPTPPAEQVLVRITHTGICGTDLKIYNGTIPVDHPLIMGHEMIGAVAGTAAGFQSGDRVIIDPSVCCGACGYCRDGQTHLCSQGILLGRDANGGFAEYVSAPARNLFRLPNEIENRAAALIQVLTTCFHAQQRAGITAGESVAVLGLGVTGQLHVQLAKAIGAHPVIGISRSAWKRELAEQLGADLTLDGASGAVKGILNGTAGLGADAVIETTGLLTNIAAAISMARPGARLLLFGITTATEGPLPFYQLYFKELTIVNSRAAKAEDFPPSIELVRGGAVRLEPLVSHVLPLAELDAAIHMLESDAGRRMKIILENT